MTEPQPAAPLFHVIASGHALPDFAPDHVQQQLQTQLKLSESNAARLLAGKPVALKRDVSAQVASDYCERLRRIGVDVAMRPVIAPTTSPSVSASVSAPASEPTPISEADNQASTSTPISTPNPAPQNIAEPAQQFFSTTEALPGLIIATARPRLLFQTLRLLCAPALYLLLVTLAIIIVAMYAVHFATLLRTPPLFFSLPVYLLPLLAGLLLIGVLLRPFLRATNRADTSITLESSREIFAYDFIAQLCALLGVKTPQHMHVDLSNTVRLQLQTGRDGWQRGHYTLTIGLPLLQLADPSTLVGALATELVFARDPLLLRTRLFIAYLRRWLTRNSERYEDRASQRLAQLSETMSARWPQQFDAWIQLTLGKLFSRLSKISSCAAETTVIEIGDRAATACAGKTAIHSILTTRYLLDHAQTRALQKNAERRIDTRLIDDLTALLAFYYEQGDADYQRKLDRNIESGNAALSGCGYSDRERMARAERYAAEFFAPFSTPPQLITRLPLASADQLGCDCTEKLYGNTFIAAAERMPAERLIDEALLDLEQSEAGKIYFHNWLIPARGWRLPDVEVLRDISHADARMQLDVCVNEVRRLTPDRARMLTEFKRLQIQLNELLFGQQVLAAQHDFQFKYLKYDGSSLTPIIEQRQREIGKILDQLTTQESIMGGRIAVGLKLFSQDSAETESLHRTLHFLGDQEKSWYRLEQDATLLEHLLQRQQQLHERGYTEAIARLVEKVEDAALRLLDKLKDAPNPPDRRYSPLRAYFDNIESENHSKVRSDRALAAALRARSILEGFYTLNEKLSLLAAEQASSVEEAYKIERIRLVTTTEH